MRLPPVDFIRLEGRIDIRGKPLESLLRYHREADLLGNESRA